MEYLLAMLLMLQSTSAPANDEPLRELAHAMQAVERQWENVTQSGLSFRQRLKKRSFTYLHRGDSGVTELREYQVPLVAEGSARVSVYRDQLAMEHTLVDEALPVWLRRGDRLLGARERPASGGPYIFDKDEPYNPGLFQMNLGFRVFSPSHTYGSDLRYPFPNLSAQDIYEGRVDLRLIRQSADERVAQAKARRLVDGQFTEHVCTWTFSRGTAGVEWLPTEIDQGVILPPEGSAQPRQNRSVHLTLRWHEVLVGAQRVAVPVEFERTIFLRKRPYQNPPTETVRSIEQSWQLDLDSFVSQLSPQEMSHLQAQSVSPRRESMPREPGPPARNWWLVAFVAMSVLLVALLIIRARMRRAA